MVVEIGQIIRNARIAKGLTQEELGRIVGVQKSAIAKYESGRVVNIKRSTLQKLAVALDLRGSDLIISSNPEEAAAFTARILLDSDLQEMVEQYCTLTAKNKLAVRQLISALAKE